MISRRNIRVKVMQTLYALESMDSKQAKPGADREMLQQQLEQTNQIFIFLLYYIARIAQYAETDAAQRASKHLPTAADLNTNIKIAGNQYLPGMLSDSGFTGKLAEWKLDAMVDTELVKKLYGSLTASEAYKAYIASDKRDPAGEKEILEYIFSSLMMKDELFDQYMDDNFMHWPDDREMMEVIVGNYFNKPRLFDFGQLISEEKSEYANDLLATVEDKKNYCLDLIRPKLQNWDSERIAAIDMLLMEMGICEFLYFPTIPTKVTINEYIDLAKTYSTPQSGQFVNGILDNILKDLETEGKIAKIERSKK